jgi:serine O-acetyltransferase
LPHHHDSIRTKADYLSFLREDLRAHGVDSWRINYRLTRPTLHFQRLLRRVEFLQSRHGIITRGLLVLARLRLARASVRLGISIPPGVFGRGLSVAHYGSVVVNDKARVGKYCRIHSATNIGIFAGGAPLIGDYVYIGPGSVIYGDITLGDEIAVGANAVVGRDFIGPATLGGAPARVISSEGSREIMPDWMPKPLPDSRDSGND